MRSKVLVCGCIILTFITSGANAAAFQWLGTTSPESFVGDKYICIDDDAEEQYRTIAVGQGVYDDYGELTDIVFGQPLVRGSGTIPCKGFVWTRTVLGHTFTTLHDFEPLLPPTPYTWDDGTATAISADGSTVVGVVASLDPVVAFRWTESEGMSYLLPIEGSDTYNIANDVSADGSIIVGNYFSGYNGDPDKEYEAFIWDAANGW